MELREWQYMNKPASNSSGSSKTNKDKFITLMYNMMKNKLPSVTDAKCIRVDDSGFTYKETRNNATLGEHTLTLLVGYNKGNSWKYELYIDTTLAETRTGDGMKELIHWLSSYFGVPAVGTKEYQSLTEWVVMKNNSNTSASYKKRFEKLIKYHIDHASSELESITKKDIKDDGFHLGEHYNTGSSEFDRTIIVSVNKYTDEFYLSIFVDGKVVYQNDYEGYEKVLEILTGSYMFLPDEGTQDYNDLLTESLNEWKYANPPKASQPASNTQSQKYRYERLLAQIDSDGISAYTVHELNDTVLDMTTDTKSPSGLMTYRLRLTITYYPDDDYYILKWDTKEHRCEDFEDALKILIKNAVIANTDLCESAGSIADDFKLYENLWD